MNKEFAVEVAYLAVAISHAEGEPVSMLQCEDHDSQKIVELALLAANPDQLTKNRIVHLKLGADEVNGELGFGLAPGEDLADLMTPHRFHVVVLVDLVGSGMEELWEHGVDIHIARFLTATMQDSLDEDHYPHEVRIDQIVLRADQPMAAPTSDA